MTPRQRDVFRLSASGLEDAEIAKTLGMSLSTVRVHKHYARIGSKEQPAIVPAVPVQVPLDVWHALAKRGDPRKVAAEILTREVQV